MLLVIFLLLFSESIYSFYLPAEYRHKRQARIKRAETYLHNYGYFEKAPLCSTESSTVCAKVDPDTRKVTQEEALKKFQMGAGIKETGIIDDETIEMMDKARCGNTDAKNLVKKDFLPWKQKWIKYAYLNLTKKLNEKEIRDALRTAFYVWELGTPLKFVETRNIENADIKISFENGVHYDCNASFDGIGGELAHGFSDGRIHFDDAENWITYSANDKPVYQSYDLLWIAIHEIGHVLGLEHSSIIESIMTPLYRTSVKRSTDSYDSYAYPKPHSNDMENVQKIYGGRVSKAAKSEKLVFLDCQEYCFV